MSGLRIILWVLLSFMSLLPVSLPAQDKCPSSPVPAMPVPASDTFPDQFLPPWNMIATLPPLLDQGLPPGPVAVEPSFPEILLVPPLFPEPIRDGSVPGTAPPPPAPAPKPAGIGQGPLEKTGVGFLKADQVIIKKGERLLYLMRQGRVLKTYRIALGKNPAGPKVQMGDYRTPEGEYILDWRNPNSKYYLSIHISYPNHRDIEKARRLGVSPGGEIMIHGLPNGLGWIKEMHRLVDWTEGCIAVTNEEIEEIWRSVPDGTPIRIDS